MTGFFAALSDLFNTWVLTALSDGIFAALSDLLTSFLGRGQVSLASKVLNADVDQLKNQLHRPLPRPRPAAIFAARVALEPKALERAAKVKNVTWQIGRGGRGEKTRRSISILFPCCFSLSFHWGEGGEGGKDGRILYGLSGQPYACRVRTAACVACGRLAAGLLFGRKDAVPSSHALFP